MRIALMGDIHYGALSSTSEFAIQGERLPYGEVSNASPLFQGLIDILKKEKIDYLIVAGDLTSTGSPLEFKNCFKKIFQLSSAIGILSENVFICLGNHDIDWRITRLIDSYKEKSTYINEDVEFLECRYRKLAHNWAVSEINSLEDHTMRFNAVYENAPLTGVIERDDFIIFILNSGHLCYHDESHKHGSLSSEQLNWFENIAFKYKDSQKAKIVLLHHHPYNYPYPLPGRDPSTLEEGSELSEICGKAGINIVIHGHRHHPKAKTTNENGWINPVTYMCVGSLSVNASHRLQGAIPNTFHIVDFISPERIVLKNYEYNFVNGWMPTQGYREEVPLEDTMILGKPVNLSDKAILEQIKKLPVNVKIYYSSLNNDLSYLYRHELMSLIDSTFDGCEVYLKSDHFMIYQQIGERK